MALPKLGCTGLDVAGESSLMHSVLMHSVQGRW